MSPLRILFAALFVYAMCRAAGQLLLHALGLQLRRSERHFLEFVTGAALVSSTVFLLAATHLVYTSVLVALGFLLFIAAAIANRRRPAVPPPDFPALSLRWHLLFWVPYLVFTCLYLIAAISPEISPDGTGYHLGLVRRYYEHRGFFFISTSMFAGLAAGIEMLFLVAFALGRHSAAAMVHLFFLLTLPFGMLAWARRANIPQAGVIGALLFYLAPVAGKDGTIAYIDVATAAVVFAAFFFLEIWRLDNSEKALIPAGIMAGFACSCKITAAPAVFFALLYIVIFGKRQFLLRRLGVTAFFSALLASPWLLKDLIQFGNPLFPLFNRWFPSPYMYPGIENEIRTSMAHVSNVPYARMFWEATVGGKLFGVLGPVFLLAPLALLALRNKAGRLLLLAFVCAFLPFFSNTGARFLLPSLPFLALALAVGILSIPRAGAALAITTVLLHAGLSWPDFMNSWSPGFQWRIDQTDWRIALRVVPETAFLTTTWRDYLPGLLLDRVVPPGDRVFSPDMGQTAYQHREVLGTFDSAMARRAYLMCLMPLVPELGRSWNRELRFPTVTTTAIRLKSATKMDTDLRISEVRFARGLAEVPRQPGWRLTSSDNPWELPYAFDNAQASWWNAGRAVDKNMYIETDFGKAVEFDRILVSQNEDQRWISLLPQALIGGRWITLTATESGVAEPARGTLRREVRDELKHLNIHWILVADGSSLATDLKEKAVYWGITQVGEANGFRLWKLN